MRIVSDTGPIIGLAKIGRIDLLRQFTEEISIPPFVHKELFGKTGIETGLIEKALGDFLKVTPVSILEPSTERLLAELDEGERQAVSLAYSFGKDVLLLMDDHAGRRAARELKIAVTGLVGVVLMAKEKGLLDSVTSTIKDLRKAGYWISDEVMEAAGRLAGE